MFGIHITTGEKQRKPFNKHFDERTKIKFTHDDDKTSNVHRTSEQPMDRGRGGDCGRVKMVVGEPLRKFAKSFESR